MKKITVISVLLLAGINLSPLFAQKDSTGLNRELLLEREYNPTIRDAVKLSGLPDLQEPQAPHTTVEYSNYAVPCQFAPAPSQIYPQTWLKDLRTSKYKGYAKAGVSSLLDIDADLGYQAINNAQTYLDFYFSHRSSNYKASFLQADSLNQKFKIQDDLGGLNFNRDFGKLRLNVDAKYTYSKYNYTTLYDGLYALGTSALQPVRQNYDPDQTNNMFEIHAGVSSVIPNTLNYRVNIGYTHFGQQAGLSQNIDAIKENRILTDWDFHKNITSTNVVGLSGYFNRYSYRKKLIDGLLSYSVFSINPYFFTEGDSYNLTLGLRGDFEIGWNKKTVIAPAIRFNYYFGEIAQFYLLAEGGRHDNSAYSMFYENRYAAPSIRVFDSRSPLDGTAGIKFLPVKDLNINVFTGYKITYDEHYFEPEYIFGGYFTQAPLYDTEKTFKVGAELSYLFAGGFDINIKGTYFGRSTDSIKPYQKPDFIAEINAGYALSQIPLRFDVSYKGFYGREIPELFDDGTVMKNINDISFKATYRLKPNLSFWCSARNVLFQKYDIWYGYPAQNFNIMAGISFLF